MTPQQWAHVLAWCAGLGYAVLLAWASAWLGMRDAVYRLHSRWFRLDRATYEALMFVMIGLFKLALMMLFLLPLIALYATGLARGSP
ncbi:DUF6868 family protein [Lysobacter sp. TY2-98]|uniref:DUF6868 family protein n=1 Tax=Lysobacter sp. TY2-98 TaxID=2290922 RepID=UPI0013B380D9|nr:hypothetical protein [Lysobacter sp. TY2-98]